VSLPAALLMFFLATLTALSLILNHLNIKLPFRFGSLASGNVVRPAIYYIVEDVVAVDGNGGFYYREAWTERYESSSVFRIMIWNLSVVWMVAFYGFALIFATLVFALPWQAVYAVGWAGPFPLAGWMVLWTIFYVREALKKEEMIHAEEETEEEDEHGILRPGEDERTPLIRNGL
jgi:hypothetical protein